MMNINEVRKLIYKHGEKIGLPYDSKLYPIFSSTGKVFSDGGQYIFQIMNIIML